MSMSASPIAVPTADHVPQVRAVLAPLPEVAHAAVLAVQCRTATPARQAVEATTLMAPILRAQGQELVPIRMAVAAAGRISRQLAIR